MEDINMKISIIYIIKFLKMGVPLMFQWGTYLTRIHEDTSSIPGLT